MRAGWLIVAAAWALPAHAQETPQEKLYRATLAAAEASLRLHETDRALRWLGEAPVELRGWEWRFLAGRIDGSVRTFHLEGGAVSDLTLSPQGGVLAAAMGSGVVHLVEPATGQVVRTLTGHTGPAWSPAFTSDGRLVATASSDGTARVWEVATGRELRVMSGNGQGVAGVAWAPDDRTLAVTSWDYTPERGVWGTLHVWDGLTGQLVHALEHGGYPIGSAAFSPDGRRLVGGTWDWDVLVWDTETWGAPVVLPPPETPQYKRIMDLAFAPDGRRVAAAYADDRVRVWDMDEHAIVHTFHVPREGQVKAMLDVAWLDDGAVLAAVGDDLTLRLWDTASGAQKSVLYGHLRPINTVAADADGRWLYTGDGAGEVRIWDASAGDPAVRTWNLPSAVYEVAFSPRRDEAVVAAYEGKIVVVDAATGATLRSWEAHGASAVGVDWSPDGRWIASTGNGGAVLLWEAATGDLAAQLEDVDRQLLSVAFSPDGAYLAAPGSNAAVAVWRVPGGEPVASLEAGEARALRVAWARDGSLLASYADGTVRRWRLDGSTPQVTISMGANGEPAFALDPAGTRLLVGLGTSVALFDGHTGEELERWAPRTAGLAALAWSPDGQRIVAALGGNLFEIWDGASGVPLLRLPWTTTAWWVEWEDPAGPLLLPLDGTIRRLWAPPPAGATPR